MDISFFWLGLGLAIAGYCIGDGLKNFKNPNAKTMLDSFDEDDDHELVRQNELHYFMNISKEDARTILQEYPEIPHIKINNNVYFPKAKLKKWLSELGD